MLLNVSPAGRLSATKYRESMCFRGCPSFQGLFQIASSMIEGRNLSEEVAAIAYPPDTS